jgi:hypothetical protein
MTVINMKWMGISAREAWQSMPAALACLLLVALLWVPSAQAKLEIEIIKGHASALPIAVVPFQWRASGYPPITSVTDVVSQDLYRSGLFKPVDEADMAERPVDAESIRFGTWRLLKTDYIVIGRVNNAPDGNGYDIVYQMCTPRNGCCRRSHRWALATCALARTASLMRSTKS